MTQENKKTVKVEALNLTGVTEPVPLPIDRNYTDKEELPEGVKRFNVADLGLPEVEFSPLGVNRGYTDETESTGPEESKKEKSIETRKNAPKVVKKDFTEDIDRVDEDKFNVVESFQSKTKHQVKVRHYKDEDHTSKK